MRHTVAPVVEREAQTVGLFGEVLRDIARGGLAGAIAGIVVAGLGGRIVMRLAAIIIPSSAGQFTENGNVIGEVTLPGTLALILFGGLLFGLVGGTVWVVISPWIPASGVRRAILAMPIAVALTGALLIQGANPDFLVLEHDGRVVGVLVALVGLSGLSLALLDSWLDDRLPEVVGWSRAVAVYAVVAVAGAVLILPIVITLYLGEATRLGIVLIGVGLATLTWWALRMTGRDRPPTILLLAGRAAVLAAVAVGVLEFAPEVAAALGV